MIIFVLQCCFSVGWFIWPVKTAKRLAVKTVPEIILPVLYMHTFTIMSFFFIKLGSRVNSLGQLPPGQIPGQNFWLLHLCNEAYRAKIILAFSRLLNKPNEWPNYIMIHLGKMFQPVKYISHYYDQSLHIGKCNARFSKYVINVLHSIKSTWFRFIWTIMCHIYLPYFQVQ